VANGVQAGEGAARTRPRFPPRGVPDLVRADVSKRGDGTDGPQNPAVFERYTIVSGDDPGCLASATRLWITRETQILREIHAFMARLPPAR
jgi:hypothetical protein